MNTDSLPQIGDVITSKDFAFGSWNYSLRSLIRVDGKTTSHPVTSGISEEARMVAAAVTGEISPKEVVIDYGAHDPSRGLAEFVVERAELEGGSTGGGMSGHDDYPDEWHVTARRLNNGAYDPNGELIDFEVNNSRIPNSHIQVVRKMKRVFV